MPTPKTIATSKNGWLIFLYLTPLSLFIVGGMVAHFLFFVGGGRDGETRPGGPTAASIICLTWIFIMLVATIKQAMLNSQEKFTLSWSSIARWVGIVIGACTILAFGALMVFIISASQRL